MHDRWNARFEQGENTSFRVVVQIDPFNTFYHLDGVSSRVGKSLKNTGQWKWVRGGGGHKGLYSTTSLDDALPFMVRWPVYAIRSGSPATHIFHQHVPAFIQSLRDASKETES